MKYVYIVTSTHVKTGNCRVSSQAYDSLEKAQAFIRKQSGISEQDRPFGKDEYIVIENNGYRYEIQDLRIV